MTPLDLLKDLLYLDRDFISSYYEVVTGEKATTNFTHQQGKKAGASIPIFSAELSAVETRNYNISSLEMLDTVFNRLSEFPNIELSELSGKKQSYYGWVQGRLSAATSKHKQGFGSDEVVLAEEKYFTLIPVVNPSLALITAENNFQPGIGALTRLQGVVLKDFSLDVRALLLILPSSTHFDYMIAVPLVILEAN